MTNRNRNQPCECGSGLKEKKCHGDYIKIILAKKAYARKLDELIKEEIDKKLDRLTKEEANKLIEKETCKLNERKRNEKKVHGNEIR